MKLFCSCLLILLNASQSIINAVRFSCFDPSKSRVKVSTYSLLKSFIAALAELNGIPVLTQASTIPSMFFFAFLETFSLYSSSEPTSPVLTAVIIFFLNSSVENKLLDPIDAILKLYCFIVSFVDANFCFSATASSRNVMVLSAKRWYCVYICP